jgi:serine/threonine protein kinase
MSAEQAQGKPVDHRTDIFSLGNILYEAATRKKAFEGDSDFTVMEKIVHDDPPPAVEVNPKTPPQLSHVIRRCLAKDPDERYQSMKDLAIELRDISAEFEAFRPLIPRRRRAWIYAVAAAIVLAGMATFLSILRPWHHNEQPRVLRAAITAPAGWSFGNYSMAVSPDGSQVVFGVRNAQGKSVLWLRRLDGSRSQILEGTEDGAYPFWSPDGREIGFISDREHLKKIDVRTGQIVTLETPRGTDGSGRGLRARWISSY